MVLNNIKISQKMKSKGQLSIENINNMEKEKSFTNTDWLIFLVNSLISLKK